MSIGLPAATEASFDTAVVSTAVTMVDFWAPWCAPCRALEPLLAELAHRYAGRAAIVKVNVEEEPALAARYKVRGIPAIALFHHGVFTRFVTPPTRRLLVAALDEELRPDRQTEPSSSASPPTTQSLLQGALMDLCSEISDGLCEDRHLVERLKTSVAQLVDVAADLQPVLRNYYGWLMGDTAWGLIQYLQTADEKRQFARLLELQGAGRAEDHRGDWVNLYEEVGLYAAADTANRIDLGSALTPLDDLSHSSIVNLHGYVERLSKSRLALSLPHDLPFIRAAAEQLLNFCKKRDAGGIDHQALT
jgi:thioredoxin 1